MNKLCNAKNNGFHIPHPIDCKKFVQCDKCYAVVKICPDGTAFDESLGNCNYDNDLNCPRISIEEVSNEEVSNKEVSNKEVSNEEVSNEEITNEEVTNEEVSDEEATITTNTLEIRRFQLG